MIRYLTSTPLEVIEKMTDQELRQLLKEDMDMGLGLAIIREMSARDMKRLSRPHWSVTPLFWVSVVAAVSACIAAYPVLFPSQAHQSDSVNKKAHNEPSKSQKQSQQLPPSQPIANKK